MNLSVSHFLTSGCNLSLFWTKTQSFLKKISLKIFILFEFCCVPILCLNVFICFVCFVCHIIPFYSVCLSHPSLFVNNFAPIEQFALVRI